MAENLPGLMALYYVLWICLPMVPAVMIYALFPKQQIGVKGPLGALTVSATGAFAAYIIVFLLALPFVNRSEELLGGMQRSVWSVSARVKLVDETGRDINSEWLNSVEVELQPEFYSNAHQFVTAFVPEMNGSLPRLIVKIRDFGSEVIDTADDSVAAKDYVRRTIIVKSPIVIRRTQATQAGLSLAPNVRN